MAHAKQPATPARVCVVARKRATHPFPAQRAVILSDCEGSLLSHSRSHRAAVSDLSRIRRRKEKSDPSPSTSLRVRMTSKEVVDRLAGARRYSELSNFNGP